MNKLRTPTRDTKPSLLRARTCSACKSCRMSKSHAPAVEIGAEVPEVETEVPMAGCKPAKSTFVTDGVSST